MFSYSTDPLAWPTDFASYEKLTGGWDNPDCSNSNNAVPINQFFMGSSPYNEVKIGTDGTVNFDEPPYPCAEGCPPGHYISGDYQQINCNVGDLYLDEGVVLDDGDESGCYYKKFDNGVESYTRIVVIEAFYGSEGTPASYCVTLYRDANYQYIEILVKSNVGGESYTGCRMGPYNVDDVSVPQTLNSVVWRGNLLGNEWTFVGEGSVVLSPRNTCSDLVCPTVAFKCLRTSKSCTCAKWKFFTAQCTRNQQALGICSGTSGAWVPAITVCNQRLF